MASLLLTLARDEAVGVLDEHGRPAWKCRFFDAAAFVYGYLFREHVDMIQKRVISSESAQALQALQHDFPNAKMHFNHQVVKIHDYKSMDKRLVHLMTGGLAFCVGSIDAINVFLRSGTKLRDDNFGLILYRITNDSGYTDNPELAVFVAMDPYKHDGILKDEDAPVPPIRIFFALRVAANSYDSSVGGHQARTDIDLQRYRL